MNQTACMFDLSPEMRVLIIFFSTMK
uniref:Uncharacterized protein n=1 Tax=Anguilla anguilla TaxID=7936 RepID=A0A0E9V3L0_ANGAN